MQAGTERPGLLSRLTHWGIGAGMVLLALMAGLVVLQVLEFLHYSNPPSVWPV